MALLLLELFLAREVVPQVSGLLLDALSAAEARTGLLLNTLELNTFNVTIDAESRSVLLQDVLDATAAGTCTLTIEDFKEAIERPNRD